jgi:hypothetical protein
MADKREQIMERLQVVAGGVAGVVTGDIRNCVAFGDTQLPAVSVLEGDEEVEDDERDFARPSVKPYNVRATPQVYIQAAAGPEIGTTLNALRAAVIKAVLSDPTLNALSLRKNSIRYMGHSTKLNAARDMEGVVVPVFAISYLMVPQDL